MTKHALQHQLDAVAELGNQQVRIPKDRDAQTLRSALRIVPVAILSGTSASAAGPGSLSSCSSFSRQTNSPTAPEGFVFMIHMHADCCSCTHT